MSLNALSCNKRGSHFSLASLVVAQQVKQQASEPLSNACTTLSLTPTTPSARLRRGLDTFESPACPSHQEVWIFINSFSVMWLTDANPKKFTQANYNWIFHEHHRSGFLKFGFARISNWLDKSDLSWANLQKKKKKPRLAKPSFSFWCEILLFCVWSASIPSLLP